MNNEYICVQIVDDSDTESKDESVITIIPKKKVKKIIKKKVEPEINPQSLVEIKHFVELKPLIARYFNPDLQIIEIGVDEVGRGPMFGRVYCAAAVLPKDDSFDHYKMKDSKKFSSKNTKKIIDTSEYIKTNALAWAIEYEDEKVIDEINILQATQSAMHKAIRNVIGQLIKKDTGLELGNILLLIDGNYFKPFLYEKEFSSAKSGNLIGKPFFYEKEFSSAKSGNLNGKPFLYENEFSSAKSGNLIGKPFLYENAISEFSSEKSGNLIGKPFLYEKEFSSEKSGNLNGKPFLYNSSNYIQFQTVEGGDNKYAAIAAASILAKVERDKYILDLCALYPDLIEKYALDSNKGYGSKVHMEGIRTFGITKWHRRTFGICKTFV
jgi:ribonuclease HII